MLKNLSPKGFLPLLGVCFLSCASSTVNWEGKRSKHVKSYMNAFSKFRKQICVPKAESIFEQSLKSYRGQGYWIPEVKEDVDVDSIKALLPEMEKKLAWIRKEKAELQKKSFPSERVTAPVKWLLSELLDLKKDELTENDQKKKISRQKSLKLIERLQKEYDRLVEKVSFYSNYAYPVDHLKNRKVHDSYREKTEEASVKIANYTFLYRKILEDGAYLKNHTSSDIYLRTTLDTIHYELKNHEFYLSEDARYDLEFVLGKIEAELSKGKDRALERLTEWEERTERTLSFYRSLTAPENQKALTIAGVKTTANRELIKEHNKATHELKEFVYLKQAEVYKYWLNQPEITRAIFVLETILINEVGGVDGEDALERVDVARVVMNRLDKPRYLSIGENDFIYPYLKKVTGDFNLQNEKWLNALFKQGEFSFTYYYMNGVAKIFCPDISPFARKLRKKNVEIALQVLKEEQKEFAATRYFSRASMIGRIHMDSIWEDYRPYPERPGLMANGQKQLKSSFEKSQYKYLYSFQDPEERYFQVVEIAGRPYAMGEKKGVKIFYEHRNPHYFRYFTKESDLVKP